MIKKSMAFIAKYGMTGSIIFLLGLVGTGISYGVIRAYALFKKE